MISSQTANLERDLMQKNPARVSVNKLLTSCEKANRNFDFYIFNILLPKKILIPKLLKNSV